MVSENNTLYFIDAKLEEADVLTQLGWDSNEVYGYRSIQEAEGKKVFQVKKEDFNPNNGVIRWMMKGATPLGFFRVGKSVKSNGKVRNSLTHFFLKPEWMGKGYGTLMFKEAMRVAKEELLFEAIEISSDPFATEFYKKMGAKIIGDNPCLLNPLYRAPVLIYSHQDPSHK